MTKEELSKLTNEVFNQVHSTEERKIVLYRGCLERGFTQEVYHCGNEECLSCNRLSEAVKEEAQRQYIKYNLDFKENESTKLWSKLRNSAKKK